MLSSVASKEYRAEDDFWMPVLVLVVIMIVNLAIGHYALN
jgi:hypothetical protein